MLRLILARHGETAWNARHIFQGRTDLPLNENGKAQARAMAQQLTSLTIDKLISSDLQRASQTAEIIAASHPVHTEIKLDERLREISFGQWEGLDENRINEVLPGEMNNWRCNPDFVPSGGESASQAMERVKTLLAELREDMEGKTIVLVGHGGILQALICRAMNIKPRFWWPFHLYNASLSELWLYPHGATVIQLNSLAHLEKFGITPDSVRGR
jgi:broad specificity phosphatase PhoE